MLDSLYTGIVIGLIVGSIGAGFTIAVLLGSAIGDKEAAAYFHGFRDGKKAER